MKTPVTNPVAAALLAERGYDPRAFAARVATRYPNTRTWRGDNGVLLRFHVCTISGYPIDGHDYAGGDRCRACGQRRPPMTHDDVLTALRDNGPCAAVRLAEVLDRRTDRSGIAGVFGYLTMLESQGRVRRSKEKRTTIWEAT